MGNIRRRMPLAVLVMPQAGLSSAQGEELETVRMAEPNVAEPAKEYLGGRKPPAKADSASSLHPWAMVAPGSQARTWGTSMPPRSVSPPPSESNLAHDLAHGHALLRSPMAVVRPPAAPTHCTPLVSLSHSDLDCRMTLLAASATLTESISGFRLSVMLSLMQVAAVALAVMAPANIAITVNFLSGLPMWAMLPALVMLGAAALLAAVYWAVKANVLPSIRLQGGSAAGSFVRNRAVCHRLCSAEQELTIAASPKLLLHSQQAAVYMPDLVAS